jgi:16S rRNA processing protein RimM
VSSADRTTLRVGRLTKAHGLKGALKLELFTDTPEQRFAPGARFSLQVPEASEWHGRTLTLTELRWYNGNPVGFFEGVDDRTAAESLVKAILWVDQATDELPQEDDAWYDHQLVGLRVERDGAVVGTVSRVDHLPAQDLLAVETEAGEVLVPFVAARVPTVDVEGGRLVVTPPAGLFEELADDVPATDDAATDAADEVPVTDDVSTADADAGQSDATPVDDADAR